jgi:hypothetical protein
MRGSWECLANQDVQKAWLFCSKDYDGNVGFMAYRKLADYGIDVTPWKTVCSA